MLCVLVMCAGASSAEAAFATEPEARLFKTATGKTLPYRLLQPTDGDAANNDPLVQCLHVAGKRGTDNAKQPVRSGMRPNPAC